MKTGLSKYLFWGTRKNPAPSSKANNPFTPGYRLQPRNLLFITTGHPMMLLQASMFRLTCIRILNFSSSSSAQLRSRTIRCKMSAESSPFTHSMNIPGQPGESVQIVAGPGVSDSEFRSVIMIVLLDPFGLLSFLSHLIYFFDQLKVFRK